MYSIVAYGEMIADGTRMRAYTQALRRAVKPGSVVLDIGTGTGVFAMLACQFGARRVYAIEPDDAIQVARDIAVASGYADRIQFIQKLSTKVSLPEGADVIISDLRGVLPPYRAHIPSIIDARERLLAPQGTLIAQRDTLWVAGIEAPDLYARLTRPWGDNTHGLDMEPARRIVTNRWGKGRVKPEEIRLLPQVWAVLDYTRITDTDVSGEATWIAETSGTVHGLAIWFDAMVAEDVHFSNAPGEPELIYGSAFVPFSDPIALAGGDKVTVRLCADLVEDDYIWRWETVVSNLAFPERIKVSFKQSTFLGVPLSPGELRCLSSDHVPRLSEDGQVDSFIMRHMDGANSLEKIARQVIDQFPNRFANWKIALNRVSELSKAYSLRANDANAFPLHVESR